MLVLVNDGTLLFEFVLRRHSHSGIRRETVEHRIIHVLSKLGVTASINVSGRILSVFEVALPQVFVTLPHILPEQVLVVIALFMLLLVIYTIHGVIMKSREVQLALIHPIWSVGVLVALIFSRVVRVLVMIFGSFIIVHFLKGNICVIIIMNSLK